MAIFDSRDDAIEAVRGALTHILELRGATVTAVSWADEALEVVQRERPGVLVSDISMPARAATGSSARFALSEERGGATPAAALTGYTGPEHRASLLRAGFQYHIEKPVQLRALIGIVAILALKE